MFGFTRFIATLLWPWGEIARLRDELAQCKVDNRLLADKLAELTDRDEKGRFVKRLK